MLTYKCVYVLVSSWKFGNRCNKKTKPTPPYNVPITNMAHDLTNTTYICSSLTLIFGLIDLLPSPA